MAEVQARKESLLAQLATADAPVPLLHPNLASLYREKVATLASALQNAESRSEAAEALRGLVDAIVLVPAGNELRIELKGNLAAMLSAAQSAKRSPEGDLPPVRSTISTSGSIATGPPSPVQGSRCSTDSGNSTERWSSPTSDRPRSPMP